MSTGTEIRKHHGLCFTLDGGYSVGGESTKEKSKKVD